MGNFTLIVLKIIVRNQSDDAPQF